MIINVSIQIFFTGSITSLLWGSDPGSLKFIPTGFTVSTWHAWVGLTIAKLTHIRWDNIDALASILVASEHVDSLVSAGDGGEDFHWVTGQVEEETIPGSVCWQREQLFLLLHLLKTTAFDLIAGG